MLTVYGIETPFYKQSKYHRLVATVLTVYGIETSGSFHRTYQHHFVATVLTVYGIETFLLCILNIFFFVFVATVLTVYGIETC